MATHILVVDDETAIADLVEVYLKNEGFTIHKFYNASDALACVRTTRLNLAVLDVMLPDMDGFTLCQRIREDHLFPIIMLTAKVEDMDKIMGLTLGADDYITKPFGTDELLARVRTAIRHTRTATGNSEIAQQCTYTVGDLTIDYNKHQVLVRGENVKLTLSEFRIVALLGKYAGKVLTYDFIIKELWGPRASGDNQILRVNMANIRRKIEKNPAEPEYLFTEVGVGYRMAESEN